MNVQTRRGLMSTTFAVLVVSCTSSNPAMPDVLVQDVTLADQGLALINGLLASLPAGQRPSDATLAQIQKYVDDFHANIAAIGTAIAPNQNAIAQVGNIIDVLAGLATPFFPIAPVVAVIIHSVLALVPGILAVIHQTPPAGLAKKAAAAGMTPDTARANLRKAVAR